MDINPLEEAFLTRSLFISSQYDIIISEESQLGRRKNIDNCIGFLKNIQKTNIYSLEHNEPQLSKLPFYQKQPDSDDKNKKKSLGGKQQFYATKTANQRMEIVHTFTK